MVDLYIVVWCVWTSTITTIGWCAAVQYTVCICRLCSGSSLHLFPPCNSPSISQPLATKRCTSRLPMDTGCHLQPNVPTFSTKSCCSVGAQSQKTDPTSSSSRLNWTAATSWIDHPPDFLQCLLSTTERKQRYHRYSFSTNTNLVPVLGCCLCWLQTFWELVCFAMS